MSFSTNKNFRWRVECTQRLSNVEREKICKCGKSFMALSEKAQYCSEPCRTKYNPNKTKHGNKYKIKHLYGVTVEEYNRLFQAQEGCCKICGKHQSEVTQKLNIDHCHTSNKIRGLLCGNCNRALGLLYENKDSVSAMLEYLKSQEE